LGEVSFVNETEIMCLAVDPSDVYHCKAPMRAKFASVQEFEFGLAWRELD